MSRILIAINNLTSVSQLAYANHCQMWYRLGKSLPQHEVGLCNPRRMSIDSMRNFAGKVAVELGFDYLLFLDDDVLLRFDPEHPIKRLLDADKDIIAGVTLIRGYPYHPMIFNFIGRLLDEEVNNSHYVDDYAKRANPETGLLECDAVGFSLCLIKTKILIGLKPPYFITGKNCTEDVYFCNKVKQEKPGAQVWVDTFVKTAHILGDDIIEPDNLQPRKAFDEIMNPGIAAKTKDSESRQEIIDPKIFGKNRQDHVKVIKEEIFG